MTSSTKTIIYIIVGMCIAAGISLGIILTECVIRPLFYATRPPFRAAHDDGGRAERIEREPDPGQAGSPASIYITVLDYIWEKESRKGLDPKCFPGVIGPHGEQGSWQTTPIYRADIERLWKAIGPYNDAECRYAAYVYLKHYAPRVGATTHYELHQLYRRGAKGYRKWKGQ